MLTAAGSALVSGASPGAMEKRVTVKVLRPFLLRSVRQEAGAVLELDRPLATELINLNKAEMHKAAQVEQKPEAPKARKGALNAGQ